MKNQKLLILLFLFCFVKGFAFENQYQIPNQYENYTPFAECEPQRNIHSRSVTQANAFDWISYFIDVEPRDGTYVYNVNGQLIKITEEDYYAYLSDADYKNYIDSGNIASYKAFLKSPAGPPIGQLTPLSDELIFLGFLTLYILIKYEKAIYTTIVTKHSSSKCTMVHKLS